MDAEARRQPPAAGQAIAGAQPPALDVGGERTCDLQERWQRRLPIEIDDELPRASHVRRSADCNAVGPG